MRRQVKGKSVPWHSAPHLAELYRDLVRIRYGKINVFPGNAVAGWTKPILIGQEQAKGIQQDTVRVR
jgi:hypothetical protein